MGQKKIENKVYGIVAEFGSPADLLHAAETVKKAGYKKFDTYSPFPIHGMDDAMGLKPSILGWLVLGGGAFGLALGFGLQTWVATSAYKLVISGKPLFSYQAFIPVTFELMVLFSAFAAVFGMFGLNRLGQLYHAIFKYKPLKTATSHGYFLSIEAADRGFDASHTPQFLGRIGGKNIEIIEN